MKKKLKESLKISIITVVFNDAENIEETIKSVINQTYKNIEYIVIDGGSTDGTVDIIKKYKKDIDYWVSETDKGIYDAMNKGAKKATGDYIHFLNSGDCFYSSNVLQSMSQYFEYDLIAGHTLFLHEGFRSWDMPSFDFHLGYGINHQGFLMKKALIKDFGLFDVQYKAAADFDMLCKFKLIGASYKITDIKVVKFLSGGFSSNKNITYLEKYKIIKKHFGRYYGYRYYIVKILFEQNLKNLLLKLHLKKVYEKLLKLKMKGFK